MNPIQKFMIMAPAFQQYHTLFQVSDKGSTLKMIQYDFSEDLFQDAYPDTTFMFQLPIEIVEKILFRMAILYLASGNFEKMLGIITISKYQIRHFFRKFFGPLDTMDIVRLNRRLSNMFKLADEIVKAMVGFPNEEHDHYFALEIFHKKQFHPYYAYNPWNFYGKVSMFQIPRPGILGVEDFRAFVTGPYITDVFWMNGYERNGLIASNFYRQPIIVLQFVDKKGFTIPEKDVLVKSKAFKGFADMLRIAFGPTSGIFFAVKDAYIFGDDLLVEL